MELELMKECPDCGTKDIQVGELEKAPGGGFYQVCPNCGSKFYFDDHDDERDRQEDREARLCNEEALSQLEEEDIPYNEPKDHLENCETVNGKRIGRRRSDY